MPVSTKNDDPCGDAGHITSHRVISHGWRMNLLVLLGSVCQMTSDLTTTWTTLVCGYGGVILSLRLLWFIFLFPDDACENDDGIRNAREDCQVVKCNSSLSVRW